MTIANVYDNTERKESYTAQAPFNWRRSLTTAALTTAIGAAAIFTPILVGSINPRERQIVQKSSEDKKTIVSDAPYNPQTPSSIMNIAAVIPNQNSRRKRKPKNTERTDDPEFWNRLREQVGRHEGFEPQAYRDSEKVLTIGYGTNLETLSAPRKLSEVGANYSMIASGREELTREQAYSLMKSDLIDAVKTAKRIFPQYDSFPEEVKLTIPDMIYNLGESRFRGFEKAIKAFKARDFETAAGEMQDSKWYDQVGNRSEYLVDLVREAA